MQPAIDALAIRAQQRCNAREPVVINTYQADPIDHRSFPNKQVLFLDLKGRRCLGVRALCLRLLF